MVCTAKAMIGRLTGEVGELFSSTVQVDEELARWARTPPQSAGSFTLVWVNSPGNSAANSIPMCSPKAPLSPHSKTSPAFLFNDTATTEIYTLSPQDDAVPLGALLALAGTV